MTTQLRAHNAGPQSKIQNTNGKYNKIQIDNTITISNGDLQKEYCTISNTLMAVMQTKGP